MKTLDEALDVITDSRGLPALIDEMARFSGVMEKANNSARVEGLLMSTVKEGTKDGVINLHRVLMAAFLSGLKTGIEMEKHDAG